MSSEDPTRPCRDCRIHERLDQMSEQLTSVDRNVLALQGDFATYKDKVDQLDTAVHGNGGRNGLKTDMAIVRNCQDSTGRWQRAQLGAMITALLSFLGMAGAFFFS